MVVFNLKDLRNKHGNMTQKDVIDKIKIRQDTLSNFENNKAKTISIAQIDALCELFDCQPSDLMTYIPQSSTACAKMNHDELMNKIAEMQEQIDELKNK